MATIHDNDDGNEVVGTEAGDLINGHGGDDIIHAGPGNDTLGGGAGNDQLNGGEGNDVIVNFTATMLGAVSVPIAVGDFGSDTIDGGEGTDTAWLSFIADSQDIVFSLGVPGAVSTVFVGGQARTTVTGVEAIRIFGGSGNDILTGGVEGDILGGGAGDDQLNGGDGNDNLYLGAGTDILNGGAGVDTVTNAGHPQAMQINLSLTGPQDTGLGTATLISIENALGGDGNDVLIGDDAANRLEGSLGDDTLQGGGGDDLLAGSSGNDNISGGAGDDLMFNLAILTATATQSIQPGTGDGGADIFDGGEGNDTVHLGYRNETGNLTLTVGAPETVSTILVNGVFNGSLIRVENVHLYAGSGNDIISTGAGADALDGGAGDDSLSGGDGDDRLAGGAGNDQLAGGAGDDILINFSMLPSTGTLFVVPVISSNGGADTMFGGEGYDTAVLAYRGVSGNFVFTLGAPGVSSVIFLNGVANGSMTGVEAVVFWSGSGNDVLTGGAGDDILSGGVGDDIISGGDGNDRLVGATGNDVINGGAGYDHADFQSAVSDLTIDLAIETAQDTGGNGIDTLISIEHATGSSGNDTLYGTFDANLLQGFGGNDFLYGRGGDDLLVGGSGDDYMDGGEGRDIASYSNFSAAVTVDLRITTAQQTGAGGMDTLISIESLSGGGGDDVLIGNGDDNGMNGQIGDDLVQGLGGDDILYGHTGDDVLEGGEGNDMLYGGGTALLDLTGDLSRTVVPDDDPTGADTLRGGAGDDLLWGGGGNDVIDGGANIDTAVFSGNRSDYTITNDGFIATVVGPDGTDTLTGVEFFQFDDQTIHWRPGTGTSVNFATDPDSFMGAIRDFDGNDLGGATAWDFVGSVDLQGDGDLEYLFFNREISRWASVGPAEDGLVYFLDHGWGGDTRIVGIYIDPLVESGEVVQGSDHDSQRRFQNDLFIGNINEILGGDDYDGDGLQEVYFALTDGTAYLHAYMHADGNIRYANYQSEEQVIDFLTTNGFGAETYEGWFD